MARVGRPPSCECGVCNKCVAARKAREKYRAMTTEERRAWVARRDIENVRAADRSRANQPQRKELAARITKRWRREDSRRLAAHNAVARAVASGRLDRQPCVKCGDPKSQAHHSDYDKKLDVIWLCAVHHAEFEGRGKS